jgi:hypothetical protein
MNKTSPMHITEGAIIRMNSGDLISVRLTPGTEPIRATFSHYNPETGYVSFTEPHIPAQRLENVFQVISVPIEHLPKKYDRDPFDTAPAAKSTLEDIMPKLCEHCGPRANCDKCPVHRTLEMLTDFHNRYYDGCAQSLGGIWIDDPVPSRVPYKRNASNINPEDKNALIAAACTFCPGRGITEDESLATDLEPGGVGKLPGEACKTCPLYKHAIREKEKRYFCHGEYVNVNFNGTIKRCYVNLYRDAANPDLYFVDILSEDNRPVWIHLKDIICSDEEYAELVRRRSANTAVLTFEPRDEF